MTPIPPEQFTRLFRGLATAQRVAFVAALWTGRGWETTIDGETVVARRNSETVRLLVVDPGRFRTPVLEDVDVLVTARDRDGVREAAADARVHYLTPRDVLDALLYGLPRDDAARLFEQTFGQPLERPNETGPTLGDRLRTAVGAARDTVSARTDSRVLVVLLLAAVLIGAAAAGPALRQSDDSATVVPVGTFTPGEAGAVGESTATATAEPVEDVNDRRPPGVGADSLVDYRALADAHAEAVLGNSRTLRVEASGPPTDPTLQGTTAWNYTAQVESPRNVLFQGRYSFPNETGAGTDLTVVNRYSEGATKYRQIHRGTETTYQRYAIEMTGDASGFAADMREYLRRFLSGDRTTVDCATALASGDCVAYRITVGGKPPDLSPAALDYRAVAIVRDTGLVSSLDVTYTVPNESGERVPVAFRFSYDDIGETTVTAPEWLSEAKNETSQ